MKGMNHPYDDPPLLHMKSIAYSIFLMHLYRYDMWGTKNMTNLKNSRYQYVVYIKKLCM